MEWSIKQILRFIQLPQLDALMNYNTVYTRKDVVHIERNYSNDSCSPSTTCWTCEHVSYRLDVNKFWAHRWSNKPQWPGCGKCLAGYCKCRWTSLASQEGTTNPKKA